MSSQTSFVEKLRAIDDSDLDVYEFRLWVHLWRVGASWESLRTIAKKCNMSLGKAQQAKKSLTDKGMLAYTEHKGRLALAAVLHSPVGQRSPHEQLQHSNCSPHEQNVHHMNTDVHVVNADVHHMNAILSMPIEVSNMKGEEDAREKSTTRRAAAPPPPVVVASYIPDRTPGGNGFHPPAEPPEPEPDPAAEERRQAIGHMANAITDVTGISARLNKAEVIPLAIELVDAGYSPSQLHRHYGKDAGPGGWNWYKDDWRGQTTEKRKGGPPRLKEIRETIVLATASVEAKTGKKLGAVERALAMFGNAPQTAPA